MPAPNSTARLAVGSVLAKRGKVTAKNPCGEMRILKRGDPIYRDDTVHTVRGANAQLKMQDQNIIMLRGGCSFRVNLYPTDAQTHDPGQRYEYVGGVLRESRRGNNLQRFDLGLS
ncbi:MAG: hypothetical protein ACK4RS_04780 [Thiothrix sp.]